MIYIHVPFCKRFCTYCDFYSEIEREGCFKPYADELCAEIRRRAREISDSPKTLYFGGGTPSVLPLSVLSRILITLDEVGHGGPYREFTMEVNPEDIVERGRSYADSLLSLGVNRISIGIQSFDDDLLRWMNRRHDAARAREAFRIVREAGFRNVSIDLIFGISHLSDEVWAATVDEAVALGPEHISCYQLTVEGESALAEMVADGRYTEADDTHSVSETGRGRLPALRDIQLCQVRFRSRTQRRLLGPAPVCGIRPRSAFFPRFLPLLEQ